MRNALDLNVRLEWQLFDGDTGSTLVVALVSFLGQSHANILPTEERAHRLRLLLKKRVVNSVHGSKIAHVVHKDGNLDHVLQRGAGFLEDLIKIS